MPARLLVVAVCLAAVAMLAVWDRDQRSCKGTELELVALGLAGKVPVGGTAAAADRLDRVCLDATPLANAAAALAVRRGQSPLALRLAGRATFREPQTFAGWVGLGDALLATGDGVRAGIAYGHAQTLNPRWAGRIILDPSV